MNSIHVKGTGATRVEQRRLGVKMFWHWFSHRSRPPSAMSRCVDHRVELPGFGDLPVSIRIDCIGASCPRPQMLAIKALETITDGDVIEIVSDNPSSVESLGSLMEVLGSTHLATLKEERQWRIYLRKGL